MIHEIRNTYLKDFGNNLKLVGFANLFVLLLLGILAYIVRIIDPTFDALFLALIFGIFFGIIYTDERKKLVVERSLKFLLPIGITFYGVNINFPHFTHLPIKVSKTGLVKIASKPFGSKVVMEALARYVSMHLFKPTFQKIPRIFLRKLF